jgi:hypothetical protein
MERLRAPSACAMARLQQGCARARPQDPPENSRCDARVRAAVASLGGLWSRGARRCVKPQSGDPSFGELLHTSIRCRSGR